MVGGGLGLASAASLLACGGGGRAGGVRAANPAAGAPAPGTRSAGDGGFAPGPAEIEGKLGRLRELMRARGLDAVLLRRVSSFAWATGGAASAINTATDFGVGELLVTASGRYLVTNTIEAPRFEREDGLVAQGWEPLVGPWYEPNAALEAKLKGLALGADAPVPGAADLSGDIARLRADLSPAEGQRFRELARRCGDAIGAAVRRVRPGQSEHEIAALLGEETAARGVWPVVDLVATDDRIRSFRHPLPTDKKLDRHAMVVLCGRKWGLVCSVTRFVHFGALSEELARKQRAVAEIDATFLAATRPGATLGDVFAKAVARYESTGFPSEWTLHHQGGAAGYEPREYLGLPGSEDVVREGQTYAWNPSITGAKSEDTILVGASANEVLTAQDDWPTIEVEIDGQTFARPAVLEL